MFIFSGFRLVNGMDDASYIQIFKLVQSGKLIWWKGLQEPGFLLIIKALGLTFKGGSLFIFFSLLSTILFYRASKRLVGYAMLPVLLYVSHKYIHNDLNQIRQGIVSLVLLNLISSKKSDWKKILLSSGIHLTALTFFPLKRFMRVQLSKIKYFLIIMASWALSFYIKSNTLAGFFGSNKYYTYLVDSRFSNNINLLSNINFYKTSLLLLVMFLGFKSYRFKINNYLALFNTYFIGYNILILFRNISLISGRLSSIFFICEPFIIFLLYCRVKRENKPIFLVLILLMSIAQLYYNLFLTKTSPIT